MSKWKTWTIFMTGFIAFQLPLTQLNTEAQWILIEGIWKGLTVAASVWTLLVLVPAMWRLLVLRLVESRQ